jgi:hypothetical protein
MGYQPQPAVPFEISPRGGQVPIGLKESLATGEWIDFSGLAVDPEDVADWMQGKGGVRPNPQGINFSNLWLPAVSWHRLTCPVAVVFFECSLGLVPHPRDEFDSMINMAFSSWAGLDFIDCTLGDLNLRAATVQDFFQVTGDFHEIDLSGSSIITDVWISGSGGNVVLDNTRVTGDTRISGESIERIRITSTSMEGRLHLDVGGDTSTEEGLSQAKRVVAVDGSPSTQSASATDLDLTRVACSSVEISGDFSSIHVTDISCRGEFRLTSNSGVAAAIEMSGGSIGTNLTLASRRLAHVDTSCAVRLEGVEIRGSCTLGAGDGEVGDWSGRILIADTTVRGAVTLDSLKVVSNPIDQAMSDGGRVDWVPVCAFDRVTAADLIIRDCDLGAVWNVSNSTKKPMAPRQPSGNRAAVYGSHLDLRGSLRLQDSVLHGDVLIADSRVAGEVGIGAGRALGGSPTPDRSPLRIVDGHILLDRMHGEPDCWIAAVVPPGLPDASSTTQSNSPRAPFVRIVDAHVGEVIVTPSQTLPDSGCLCVSGTAFGGLHLFDAPELVPSPSNQAHPPSEAGRALALIRRYSPTHYDRQPYLALAKSLSVRGQPEAARTTLIQMHEDERHFGNLNRIARGWNFINGRLAGHGYKIHRAVLFILIPALVLSLLTVYLAWSSDSFMQAQPDVSFANASVAADATASATGGPGKADIASELVAQAALSSFCTDVYPCLNPLVYTLDTAVPIATFQQTEYWQPKGYVVRFLLALFTVMAWIGITILIASLSSLKRHEHLD